jgi:hypothetical protein
MRHDALSCGNANSLSLAVCSLTRHSRPWTRNGAPWCGSVPLSTRNDAEWPLCALALTRNASASGRNDQLLSRSVAQWPRSSPHLLRERGVLMGTLHHPSGSQRHCRAPVCSSIGTSARDGEKANDWWGVTSASRKLLVCRVRGLLQEPHSRFRNVEPHPIHHGTPGQQPGIMTR